ncbi:YciI family protein [Kineosporia sp. R_H_3]|uniref:YciI family protein n=1 Tax=Kineosporia sp. R_H_3 TaxID=1961848 RepID=UPI000B4B82CA|nr:YciI family protein [Kineosporia sp. R_H_3]
MDVFCYHRDRVGSTPLRQQLSESHWAYMDAFQDRMIARGPTFTDETLTGSVHIVSLPDPAAARAFAFDEPCYQAGAYRDVLIRRWESLSDRTMYDPSVGSDDSERFLVLGFTVAPTTERVEAPYRPGTIVCGELLSDDGIHVLGAAALVQPAVAGDVRDVLPERHYAAVEVHRWDFGGRR